MEPLRELGEKLVSTVQVALAELVKNAYDADATVVKVAIIPSPSGGPRIVIEDNGSGMTPKEVAEFWMRIGTTNKEDHPRSVLYGRPRTGKKGVGRFACRRLGTLLELETIAVTDDRNSAKQTVKTSVVFDWNNFTPGTTVESIPCKGLTQKSAGVGSSGTKLIISNAEIDEWQTRSFDYLMEFPHECSEQTFNRLYANALARHIAVSDPRIRKVFDQWKATPALDGPLEKNQDLKMVMLEETPWLQYAKGESAVRRNVGILFDAIRLDGETASTLRKLTEMQLSDGRWPWFPGGSPSDFITLYVVTGFGRLRHLGVDMDVSSATRALDALDGWMDENYRRITNRETYVPSSIDALYLYGRSFFLKDRAIAARHREAVDFYLGQARKFWLKLADRQSQAHLAVALSRFNAFYKVDDTTPKDIMRSIKERSVSTGELGMFWRELELSWWWYRAPIETQAMMIEGFREVMDDKQAVEDCQTWLLKQKQTQDWKTTKATADAVYALLLQGSNKLASSALVEVSLGGKLIQPKNVEAGTGFYEERFVKGEVQPELGRITLKKVDDGVSWGSLHWQYLEDMTKVTPYEGTPLKLKKTLFIKDTTAKGQVLKPVTGAISVGDELVVRIELRVDRDMEYIHLKDQRGSGTEPVNVLSRYRYQDGLAYYENTRDTASHFFIDYLPKGTYVFEYSVRVQLRGRYQTGVASIQSMYAPEFNSHSESFELEVK